METSVEEKTTRAQREWQRKRKKEGLPVGNFFKDSVKRGIGFFLLEHRLRRKGSWMLPLPL